MGLPAQRPRYLLPDDPLSTSTVQTFTADGIAAPAFSTTAQSLSVAVADPLGTDVNAVLAANSHLKTAFATSSPSFFGIGELGGSYDSDGISSETDSQTMSFVIDPSKMANPQDLIVGLYSGTVVGSGFTDLDFTIMANGIAVDSQDFTSTAEAQTYFNNHALDLGSLTTLADGGSLDLQINMSETTNAAGAGFYAGLLIGDPPPAAPSHGSEATSGASAGTFVYQHHGDQQTHSTFQADGAPASPLAPASSAFVEMATAFGQPATVDGSAMLHAGTDSAIALQHVPNAEIKAQHHGFAFSG